MRYHRDQRYECKKGIVADLEKGKIKDGFGNIDTVKNIESISGNDSYGGGKGSDTVNFDFWEDLGQKGVIVDLRKAKDNILDDGFGNKETAKSIENVNGSSFDDDITLGKADGWAWGYPLTME